MSRENYLTSFTNGARSLVKNEANPLQDRLESLGSQFQIVRLLFEDLMAFSQAKAHSYLRSVHTGSILFALA